MIKYKIVILTSLLAIVFYAIYSLQSGQFNFANSTAIPRLNWCANRVIEIVEENPIQRYRIFQEGMEWIFQSEDRLVLEKTVMEKWLGQNCELVIDELLEKPSVLDNSLGTIKTRLLNGQTYKFERFKGGVFSFNDQQWFKSSQWSTALAELALLPEKKNQ